MAHTGATIVNNSHIRWKTREAAQKVADANNDPDDDTADYYLVEEVSGRFVIVVFDAADGRMGLL